MIITNNVSGVFPYEECMVCEVCKPYLKKTVILGGGNEDPDKTLYELRCSHQEACGKMIEKYSSQD